METTTAPAPKRRGRKLGTNKEVIEQRRREREEREMNSTEEGATLENMTNVGNINQFEQNVQDADMGNNNIGTDHNDGGGESQSSGNKGFGNDRPGYDPDAEDTHDDRDMGEDDGGDEGEDYTSTGGKGNLQDLPPHTKRKAINRTAEMFTNIYVNILPMLPKFMAKVPETKLHRLSMNDEIDLTETVQYSVDGEQTETTTVGDYILRINAMADQVLCVSEKGAEEFKECLKDVLEEKQVAATPTQRLIAIVALQAFSLMGAAFKMSVERKSMMDMYMEKHAANKARKEGAESAGVEKETKLDRKKEKDNGFEHLVPEEVD